MSQKISLCMIVGNVEEYIERCLTSFKPIADEIVVVRAIGCAKPDKTLDIAREKFRAVTAEYKNKPGHEDWPHVDDFAAARQMSFDLASNDLVFWCDSDDILEKGAEVVRELADRGGYAAYVFPYKIQGRGLSVPRERMMLRHAGVWKFPVHECFDFHIKPVQGVEDNRVVVTHLPYLDKTGSNERNLRIIHSIPEKDLTTGMLYHLHLELLLAGKIDEGVEMAKKALARSDLGRAEKYEIFTNLTIPTDDPNQKAALLHQAYAVDPGRREALGLLCNNALNYGHFEDALAYARQMVATPVPRKIEWNHRQPMYDWIGDDLYAQALRANGQFAEAERVRLEAFAKVGGPRIALIHATRGRCQEASKARKLWFDLAKEPDRIEHVFCIDSDDEDSEALQRMHHVRLRPGGGCVAAWNMGAFATLAPVMVQLSDDWVPPEHWDQLIIDRMGDLTKPSVLAISDGHRTDKLLCMLICTRAYWRQDWFMFHPWFPSVYSDNWATEVAYKRKQVIEARDLVFEHVHPVWTGKPMDKTYAESNAPERYKIGQEVIADLRRGVDWSSCEGWFNYWPFYQSVAKSLKDGDEVAEIGVWQGRSIIYLAQELKRLGKKVRLYAIDTFKGDPNEPEHRELIAKHGGSVRAIFEANIKRCGVEDMITVIEGDSAESAAKIKDGSLAFCYIDAAHDYESVKRDLLAWKSKVRPKDGLICGHDAQHEPVIRAVKEVIGAHVVNGPCWFKK